jgi:hypothetical protein
VSISTAVLPQGWRDRLVPFTSPETGQSRAVCLEPHDLVVSKLVAGREKDFEFAAALLSAGLVDADVLLSRAEMLPIAVRARTKKAVERTSRRTSV